MRWKNFGWALLGVGGLAFAGEGVKLVIQKITQPSSPSITVNSPQNGSALKPPQSPAVRQAAQVLRVSHTSPATQQALAALVQLETALSKLPKTGSLPASTLSQLASLAKTLKGLCGQLPHGSAVASQSCQAATALAAIQANKSTTASALSALSQNLGAQLDPDSSPLGKGTHIDMSTSDLADSEKEISDSLEDLLSWLTELKARLTGRNDPDSCMPIAVQNPRNTQPSLQATDLFTQQTSTIQQAAVKLGSPQSAFFFVRDQIQFLPRFGAAQTASQVLVSGAGTAADKSTLLIALLRALGTPAQYMAGEVLAPEAMLKSLFGVAGRRDLHWALRMTAGPADPSEPRVLYRNGQRVWRLPHVWVHAFLNGAWVDLDPVGALQNEIKGTHSSNPVQDNLNAYFFQPDAQGNWVKSGTLVDELMSEAGPALQASSTSSGGVPTVGLIDEGASVSDHETTLPLGTIGVGNPCVQAQADLIPDGYQFKTVVRIDKASSPDLRVEIPLAQARGQTLMIEHSAGLAAQGATGPGHLVLSSGGATLATSASTYDVGDSFDIYHAIVEPKRYGGRRQDRTTPDNQAGGVQVISHAIAPVTETDLNQEIQTILSLQQAQPVSQSAVDAELLRYAGVLALVRASENDRDLGILRGVSHLSESLILTQSLSGQVQSASGRDLGVVPLGTTMDWLLRGAVYSATGNHRSYDDYSNITQAKGEAVVAASSVENEVWEDLYGQSAISTVNLLQLTSFQNYEISQGNLKAVTQGAPSGPSTSAPVAVGIVQGQILNSQSTGTIFGQFGSGMQPNVSLLQSYAGESPYLYSVNDTVIFPSGWSGVGFILFPSKATGRAEAFIQPTGLELLLGGGTIPLLPYSVQALSDIYAQLEGSQCCQGDANSAYCPFDDCGVIQSYYDAQFAYWAATGIPSFANTCVTLILIDVAGPYSEYHGVIGTCSSSSSGGATPPSYPPSTTPAVGSTNPNGTPATSPNPTQIACGQPVNLSSGAMWHMLTDFAQPGVTPATSIAFKRTYLAQPAVPGTGDFGPNWVHNWETRLLSQSSSTSSAPNLIWIDETGGPWLFTRNTDGTLSAPPAVFMTLTESSDHYTLMRKDGVSYTFSRSSSAPIGRLTAITEPHGNSVQITYDSNGNLATISEPLVGTISITRNSGGQIGQITRVRDNLSYTYAYTSGVLTSSADFDNNTTRYAYITNQPGTAAQGLLSSITDPLARQWTFTYYPNGRAYEQTEPGQAYRAFMYSIDGPTDDYTRVLDVDGDTIQFNFDDEQRLVSRMYPDGSRDYQTWDALGDVTSTTDEVSNTIQYTFDSRGNVTGSKNRWMLAADDCL